MAHKHLSRSDDSYEFVPPDALLDPAQVPQLVRALVETLALKAPAPRASAPAARVCMRCGVQFEGLYADPVCTSCWMKERTMRSIHG